MARAPLFGDMKRNGRCWCRCLLLTPMTGCCIPVYVMWNDCNTFCFSLQNLISTVKAHVLCKCKVGAFCFAGLSVCFACAAENLLFDCRFVWHTPRFYGSSATTTKLPDGGSKEGGASAYTTHHNWLWVHVNPRIRTMCKHVSCVISTVSSCRSQQCSWRHLSLALFVCFLSL